MKLYDELKWRGLIKDEAGEDLEDKINSSVTFYWGTDPTADSLHIGHYSSLMTAKRLAKAGHHPILLVGGATGLIGDPRPTSEREIISKEAVLNNVEALKKQVTKIFDGNVEVVNNYDWLKDMNILDFLRDVGKYINVNYMLSKDIISRRLETGITFAEFTYTLLQGYDFMHLFKEKNCIMQASGSDQWGNITTGIELINKKLNKKAYAFTMPLILDEHGNKFGKSEGNALWLDINKTSSYEMYQYLINSSDEKVEEYLKVFTFLSKEEIEDVVKKHKEKPEERSAQKILAKEIITDLHGKEELEKAIKMSEALFTEQFTDFDINDIEEIFKDYSKTKINKNMNIVDLVIELKAASSKREAREFITNNAISINGEKINDLDFIVTDALCDKYIILKRGKRNYYIGVIE